MAGALAVRVAAMLLRASRLMTSTGPPIVPSSAARADRSLDNAASTRWSPDEVRALLLFVGVGLGLAAAAALAASVVWSPAELEQGGLQSWFGLEAVPCPGCMLCGLSRGFAHLSRGRLAEAIELNVLAPFIYSAALLLVAWLPLGIRALWQARRHLVCGS